MRELIAYCGLDCEKCDARRATMNNDNQLREKTAKLWSELNGIEIGLEMINCIGCRTDGVKTYYCSDLCPIRKCAVNKRVHNCGECGEADKCEVLGILISNNKQARENLNKLL